MRRRLTVRCHLRLGAGLGYKGVQVPTSDPRLIDIDKAAASQTYCDEIAGVAASHGLVITEDIAEIVEKGERFSKLRIGLVRAAQATVGAADAGIKKCEWLRDLAKPVRLIGGTLSGRVRCLRIVPPAMPHRPWLGLVRRC